MAFSTPNRIIWEYFDALQRLERHSTDAQNEATARQYAAMAIMLSITVVDAFINIYFRVVVGEPAFNEHEELVLRHIRQRKPTDEKLRQWTRRIFGNPFDTGCEAYRDFERLSGKRHALVHFKSSHETREIGSGIVLNGLADTTIFDELTAQDAALAVNTARAMLAAIFLCRGIPEERIPGMMHGWTGYPVPELG